MWLVIDRSHGDGARKKDWGWLEHICFGGEATRGFHGSRGTTRRNDEFAINTLNQENFYVNVTATIAELNTKNYWLCWPNTNGGDSLDNQECPIGTMINHGSKISSTNDDPLDNPTIYCSLIGTL